MKQMKRKMMLVGMMLTAFAASAQTFVSTQPGKRNALIEEYTGVNCQYCPLGHKATDQTVEAFPGRVFAINIHQGTFASRFTTQWGNALAGQASISGYPSSTLSRHAFFGNSIHIDPGQAYSCAAEILEMDAPVNVAATVDIDPQSRLMVVKVEVYYTADANGGTNMLNVALVQNNVLYYQAGASSYYPENMVNGEYQHKHILRDLLTGQWGDTIHQTTAGSFFTKEYAYVIPQQIGDLEVPDVDDLSVVVFVCEGRKEVLNACEAIRTGDKAYIAHGHAGGEECSLEWNPYVTVVNPTDQPIDNLKFNVDGSVVTRNKTIAPYCSDTVRIAHFAIDAMPEASQSYSQSVSVAFSSFASNGHEVAAAGDPVGISYGNAELYTAEGPLTLRIRYDSYPTEVSFTLAGMDDCCYYYQTTGSQSDAGATREYTLSPATAGLYRLKVYDVGGDGLSGTVAVVDAQGNTLFSRNGSDLMVWDDLYLNITTAGSDGPQDPVVAIDDVAMQSVSLQLYPNPATDRLMLSADMPVQRVQVFDMTGRMVMSSTGTELDVSALPAGLYMLRAMGEAGVGSKKFIKK
ncbi:MAG: Omp28-related outer membrane protein [Bacteroidales bacterium]|nr:Omp28-related outer membrane protein [Bacteroidales bacterium]